MTNFVIDARCGIIHIGPVLDHEQLRAELIRQLEVKSIKAKDVAALLNVAPSRVSEIKKGERRIQPDEMSKVAQFLGLSEPIALDSFDVQMIPVIGIASAGAWNEAVQTPIRTFPMPAGRTSKRSFAVEIRGDSMNRLLPEGGWAVVDPDQDYLFHGRVYLIENGDHDTTIKRYCNDPARFEPVSDNPDHQPIYLVGKPYRVIGRVVAYGNDEGL